jgi:hypothetical protein
LRALLSHGKAPSEGLLLQPPCRATVPELRSGYLPNLLVRRPTRYRSSGGGEPSG